MEKNKKWKVVRVVVFILIFWIAIHAFLPVLTSDRFQLLVQRSGWWGPLVIILYTIIEDVFAPLSGLPALVAGAAVFGLLKTQVYIYIASLFSSCLNFWISRRYGRTIVKKFSGEEALVQIDAFARHFGSKLLIIGRLFAFSFFDVISYAAGLTTMSFKTYLLITAIGTLFSKTIVFVVFRNTDFTTAAGFFTMLGTLVTVSVVFTFFFRQYARKKENVSKIVE